MYLVCHWVSVLLKPNFYILELCMDEISEVSLLISIILLNVALSTGTETNELNFFDFNNVKLM